MIDISCNSESTRILEAFGKLRRGLNLKFVHALKPLGLGPKQAVLVRHLSQNEPCSLADLSRATVTDPAATGRAVDALIRKGWVAQREHPTDRRRWEVLLTAKGKAVARQVEKIYAAIAGEMVAVLAAAERKRFHRLLAKLANGLGARQEEMTG